MNYKEYYSGLITSLINKQTELKTNIIFVHLGDARLLNTEHINAYIADNETFYINGDEEIFDQRWFTKIFTILQHDEVSYVLSFAQFSYLIYYISASFFSNRIVILRDNLRQLFPIAKEEYLEKNDSEDIEARPKRLPIYQAEQMKINDKYYYSVKMPADAFELCDIFTASKDCITSNEIHKHRIDVGSDPYAIDVFISECIKQNDFSKKTEAQSNSKQQLSLGVSEILNRLNALLFKFGGELFIKKEEATLPAYQASEELKAKLVKYWGEGACFRDIYVYKNPNVSNEVIGISQGVIAETIIQEYNNSKAGMPCRDLFLTASTGAGKSLLFQLPAFCISEKHDVTIVVSPLIALMKDQVEAIKANRNYDEVAYINSELNLTEREKVIEDCKCGQINILYMSPELLLSYDIKYFIGDRRLGLLVIDEAHLITTWGRDFRVDYWFLGSYIRKIRKYHDLDFPMVALTATAIYGGANDMVFDSIDSLAMNNPHIFIGGVKRDNIEFLVNTYENFQRNYESNKLKQTVGFIEQISILGLKTLVYAPYTRHIRQILAQVNAALPDVATGYYGSLESLEKEYAYRQFKNGDRKVMISTKAFGMGVDIPDIQVVYHHAPSGLLPDYVQEIGRVARNPEMQGYAALNYSSQDQRYTRALHGMSALRQNQIKSVLKKIYNTYLLKNKSRNLLLSVDDFGYIFEDAQDLNQKLLTALMMIEKDYLAKNRFNVIVARPKKLFVKVFARVSQDSLKVLTQEYKNNYRVLRQLDNGNTIIKLDLDQLWHDHFNSKSFPAIKKVFYEGNLLKERNIKITPQLKISYTLSSTFDEVNHKITRVFIGIKDILASTTGFFVKDILRQKIEGVVGERDRAEKLAKLILSSYSGVQTKPGFIDANAFLQRRKSIDGIEYRVFGTHYLACFNSLTNLFNQVFIGTNGLQAERFVTNNEVNTIDYIRLGFFIEILDLGSYEVVGGENPMVFIRINDPDRVRKDSVDPNYRNMLLAKTLERHQLSNQIYDHFFLRMFTNEERWQFIEDYFLGLDIDSILNKYKGYEASHIDIIQYLSTQNTSIKDEALNDESNEDLHIFQPRQKPYTIGAPITISDENGVRTKKISEWLNDDPVALDKSRRSTPFFMDHESYNILISKLKAHHLDYYKKVLGLKYIIEFNGYSKLVKAIIPYKTKPVQFYEWWCLNPNGVVMSDDEKKHLFGKVYLIKKSALKAEHKKILGKN